MTLVKNVAVKLPTNTDGHGRRRFGRRSLRHLSTHLRHLTFLNELGPNHDLNAIGSHVEQSSDLPPELIQTLTSTDLRLSR